MGFRVFLVVAVCVHLLSWFLLGLPGDDSRRAGSLRLRGRGVL